MEAFSDGVFAIAITLLVLEIHVPEPGAGDLGHELAAQWPSYAAYVVSFLTIGIIWINHHAMVRRLQLVDHSILIWNLVLLMTVSVLPFTTALVAAYLRESSGEALAAAIYSGSLLVMSVAFTGMQPPHPPPPPHLPHRIDRRADPAPDLQARGDRPDPLHGGDAAGVRLPLRDARDLRGRRPLLRAADRQRHRTGRIPLPGKSEPSDSAGPGRNLGR